MLLAVLSGLVRRSLNRARRVYVIPFDMQGAFGNVSHRPLMRATEVFGVEPYDRLAVRNCLRHRTPQVKLRANDATHLPGNHTIGKGSLQEEVPPPLLWLTYFEIVAKELARTRESRGTSTDSQKDMPYADD